MKQTTFNNINYTTNMPTNSNTVTMGVISANQKTFHLAIVTKHLTKRNNNKILQALPPNICSSEETHTRQTLRTLDQLRTNNSPFLKFYLHKIDAYKHLHLQLQTHTHNIVTPGFVDKPHG